MWDVTLVPIKVLSDSGTGTILDVADGILYAANLHDRIKNPNPVHVMNLSLGADLKISETIGRAVRKVAKYTDIIMVAATGNRSEPVLYPAAFPEVIAVGSVEPNQESEPTRAPYSNYGPEVELVAFGGSESLPILSTGLKSGYGDVGDIHGSTPCFRSDWFDAGHGIEPSAVRPILQTTAVDLGPEGGILNTVMV